MITVKNGLLLINNNLEKRDLYLEDGKIKDICENLEVKGELIDAEGCFIMNGAIDAHVHLRQPGYEYKETIKSGTMAAAKGGVTSIITMPNLAFVDGIEVYMLYAYKITFAVMIVALAVSLYMDAVQNKLGIKSVITFIVTCMGVLLSFTVLPDLVGWSYYNANKSLLAEESGHIMMLNYVKDLDGAEISVTEIRTPESSTDLYLKVGTFDLRWWDIVGDVLFKNSKV